VWYPQGSANSTTVNFRSATIQRGALQSRQFLWNVCGPLDITLSQFQLLGSLLAPTSTLTISNAEQEGITVVSALAGQGFQKRLAPFNGFFCQPL
jgi:choice-of-anchor A domain-containing protein